MKKFYIIMSLLIMFSSYGNESLSFYQGASLGNVDFDFGINKNSASMDLFGYRLLNTKTGLGFTTYILPIFENYDLDHEKETYGGIDLFSMEINWEPTFNPNNIIGWGLFSRFDNFIPGGNEFNLTAGARVDLRYNFSGILYSFIGVEGGYNMEKGPYIGLSIDPITFIAAGVFFTVIALSGEYEDAEDEYYENNKLDRGSLSDAFNESKTK